MRATVARAHRKSARKARRDKVRQLVVFISAYYAQTYLLKEPCHISVCSGRQYMDELHAGSANSFRRVLRVNPDVFEWITEWMVKNQVISATQYVAVDEQLAIFLYIVGQGTSNWSAQDRFQHSGWTISKYVE
jgi:hypothetical protein